MSRYLIETEAQRIEGCEQIILVLAESEGQEKIELLCHEQSSSDKHQLHSVSQMIYFQFQDRELEPVLLTAPLTLQRDGETTTMEQGLCICRTADAMLHVFISEGLSAKEYIEKGVQVLYPMDQA